MNDKLVFRIVVLPRQNAAVGYKKPSSGKTKAIKKNREVNMTNSVKGCGSPDKCSRSDSELKNQSQRGAKAMNSEASKTSAARACGNSAESASCKGRMNSAETSSAKDRMNAAEASCAMGRASSGAANSSSKASCKGVTGAESALMKKYKCAECGQVVKSDKPPKKCSKCDCCNFSVQ